MNIECLRSREIITGSACSPENGVRILGLSCTVCSAMEVVVAGPQSISLPLRATSADNPLPAKYIHQYSLIDPFASLRYSSNTPRRPMVTSVVRGPEPRQDEGGQRSLYNTGLGEKRYSCRAAPSFCHPCRPERGIGFNSWAVRGGR